MIRLASVIMVLAAIAVALVHLRREEAQVRHSLHRLVDGQTTLRRGLWDKRVEIGRLVAPTEVRRRSEEMALDLTGEDQSRRGVAVNGSQ